MTVVKTKELGKKYEIGEDGKLHEIKQLNRLFVYGIFLGETMRKAYGMTNPRYMTVPDYVTVGGHIVQAVKIDSGTSIMLTGLTVDVDPENWERLDRLEGGYDRVKVKTHDGEEVYMYVAPER